MPRVFFLLAAAFLCAFSGHAGHEAAGALPSSNEPVVFSPSSNADHKLGERRFLELVDRLERYRILVEVENENSVIGVGPAFSRICALEAFGLSDVDPLSSVGVNIDTAYRSTVRLIHPDKLHDMEKQTENKPVQDALVFLRRYGGSYSEILKEWKRSLKAPGPLTDDETEEEANLKQSLLLWAKVKEGVATYEEELLAKKSHWTWSPVVTPAELSQAAREAYADATRSMEPESQDWLERVQDTNDNWNTLNQNKIVLDGVVFPLSAQDAKRSLDVLHQSVAQEAKMLTDYSEKYESVRLRVTKTDAVRINIGRNVIIHMHHFLRPSSPTRRSQLRTAYSGYTNWLRMLNMDRDLQVDEDNLTRLSQLRTAYSGYTNWLRMLKMDRDLQVDENNVTTLLEFFSSSSGTADGAAVINALKSVYLSPPIIEIEARRLKHFAANEDSALQVYQKGMLSSLWERQLQHKRETLWEGFRPTPEEEQKFGMYLQTDARYLKVAEKTAAVGGSTVKGRPLALGAAFEQHFEKHSGGQLQLGDGIRPVVVSLKDVPPGFLTAKKDFEFDPSDVSTDIDPEADCLSEWSDCLSESDDKERNSSLESSEGAPKADAEHQLPSADDHGRGLRVKRLAAHFEKMGANHVDPSSMMSEDHDKIRAKTKGAMEERWLKALNRSPTN